MKYPEVLSEEATLERVLAGASIGRFGDGEMNIVRGGDCVSQVYDGGLAQELRLILGGCLNGKAKDFLVGIPTLDPRCPKLINWQKQAEHFRKYTIEKPQTFTYGSAFISRPDSAPWINTKAYFDGIQSLWQDQEVVLVANGRRSLTKAFLEQTGAGSVAWVECPYRDAYTQAGALARRVHDLAQSEGIRRVILCCGPTATVLADRLAGAGLHAVDLGHCGMFWRAYEKGDHLTLAGGTRVQPK